MNRWVVLGCCDLPRRRNVLGVTSVAGTNSAPRRTFCDSVPPPLAPAQTPGRSRADPGRPGTDEGGPLTAGPPWSSTRDACSSGVYESCLLYTSDAADE